MNIFREDGTIKPYAEALLEFEREYVREAIKGRSVPEAAKIAGRDRSYFYRLMKRLSIPRRDWIRREGGNWHLHGL